MGPTISKKDFVHMNVITSGGRNDQDENVKFAEANYIPIKRDFVAKGVTEDGVRLIW